MLKAGIVTGNEKAGYENYEKAAAAAGFSPFPVTPADGFSPADALVFTGGGDIHPRFLPSGAPIGRNISTERDAFELALFRLCYGRIPILGICRGMQVGAAALGGQIANIEDPFHQHPQFDIWHEVSISPGSFLDVLLPGGRVNSNHHQAVSRLPDAFKIACRTADGVLEGAHGKKTLLVQFHPERMGKEGAPFFTWLYEMGAACLL